MNRVVMIDACDEIKPRVDGWTERATAWRNASAREAERYKEVQASIKHWFKELDVTHAEGAALMESITEQHDAIKVALIAAGASEDAITMALAPINAKRDALAAELMMVKASLSGIRPYVNFMNTCDGRKGGVA